MMKRIGLQALRSVVGLAAAAAILAPASASAQITRVSGTDSRHAINFNIGYFALKGEDGRVDNDVLVEDLNSLAFDIKDFNGASVGGEWLINVGEYLEAGVGVGFYRRTVPSVYRDFQNANGSEIEQDLKLRIIPMTATVRFLPIGRGRAVEPYVGVGIGAFNWRYTETGEFVDFSDDSIFRQTYKADGTAVGPVVLGGIRAAVADVWLVGGELRWQRAEGDTDSATTGLLADKIDLGGWTTSFTFGIRF
jgi:opacity protein-like surface antigen